MLSKLLNSGNVYLTGAVGIGKTALLQAIRRRLLELEVEVITVSGMEATSVVPLAPLLRLCPPGAEQAGPAIITELYRRSRSRRVVLLVDDAHLLDHATAAIVRQAAGIEANSLVVAVRDGEQVPTPISSILTDELATSVVLRPLDRASTVELTELLTGPADPATLQMIWEQSRGNPLYVRELLAAGGPSGADVDLQGCDADGAPRWTSRLQSLLARRIRRLTEGERDALCIVAVGGRVPRGVLTQMVSVATVLELDRHGLVVIDDASVEIGHPLYATAVLANLTEVQARHARLRLADALHAAGSTDLVLMALLRLDAGEAVDTALLRQALDVARRPHLPWCAERLSRQLLEQGDDPDVRMMLAEALGAQGEWDEAATQYEAAITAAPNDTVDLRERWALLNFEYGDDLEHNERIIREVAPQIGERGSELWEIVNLRFELFTGDLDRAIVANRAWLARRPASPLRSAGLVQLATAASHCGDFAAGLDASDDLGRPAGLDPVEQARMDGVTLQCQRWLRGRRAAPERLARSMRCHAASGDPEREILSLSYEGMTLNDLTCPVEALPHLRKAMTIKCLARRRLSGRLIQVELARALASIDDGAGEAELLLRELSGAPSLSMWMVQPLYKLTESMVLLRSGRDPSPAIAEGVRAARRRSARIHEVPLLRLSGELGAAADAVPRADELARRMGGGHAGLVARELAALAEQSPSALDEVAADAWSFGSLGLAADAAALATGFHLQRGDVRAALFSQLRSDAVVGDRPQWSFSRSTMERTMSDRELQVATAVSAGASNREAAAQFFISHRTVESHLRRIYLRYGFDGRDELAEFVDRATRLPVAGACGPR